MTSLRDRVPIAKSWQPFFNTCVQAAYHFDLLLVTLDQIDGPILKALGNQVPAARNKVLPLVVHEYTHWMDHVGSLWGRRLLTTYFQAKVAREKNDPNNFTWMVEAKKAILRCTSKRYYFTLGPANIIGPPWAWSLSLGCRFDRAGRLDPSDPIPFIVFGIGDTEGENRMVRMPISPAALCEVRAMAAECAWVTEEEATLGPENTPASKLRWLEEYANTIYAPNMLIYSTALHLLANHCNCDDFSVVLPSASALAWIALNFPPSLVNDLRIPPQWTSHWRPPSGTLDRITPLLKACDPGFIYTLLCTYARSPIGMKVENWLEETLVAAMGKSLEAFQQEWQIELAKSTREQTSSLEDANFHSWMDLGSKWARTLGVIGSSRPLLERLKRDDGLPLPEALTSDFEGWSPTGDGFRTGDGLNCWDRCQEFERVRDKIDEFLEICGL